MSGVATKAKAKQVSATVTAIGTDVARADTSRQIYQEDEFSGIVASGAFLLPPYSPSYLFDVIERSNMLKQCIEAVVTNVGRSGFEATPIDPESKALKKEIDEIKSFIDCANADESFTTVHAKLVEDYESVGYCFLEVIRDISGRISLLRHMKSLNTRLCRKDENPQRVTYQVKRGGRTATIVEEKTFRRYLQIVNGRPRYFKEFGDPRKLHYLSGEFGTVTPNDEATEVIHIRQNSNDPYGVPRWINQLPNILGSRESEECNLRYFEDNTVPPMMLSIAGGRLTQQSYRDLQKMVTQQGVGKDRQHKIMIIEAVPEKEGLDDKGTVTVRVDKLTDARQSDGLFKEYDEGNQAKVRSSFRLPPVAVGLSQDVTFATANVSAFLAETQVYAPQRNMFVEIYNKTIVHGAYGLGMKTAMLSSKVPYITSSESIVKSLTALNVMGAITPRMANASADKLLQLDIPDYPEKGQEGYEEWMDMPISLSLKQSGNTGIDPAGAGNTHDGQGAKDPATKDTETDGVVTPSKPENGQE